VGVVVVVVVMMMMMKEEEEFIFAVCISCKKDRFTLPVVEKSFVG
jgi:hypothetical protein